MSQVFKLVALHLVTVVLLLAVVAAFQALIGCATTPAAEPAPVMVQRACPDTKVLAMDSSELTPQDLAALRTARVGCATKHAPDNTCLKKFIRIEHGRYHAVCGPAN